MKQVWFIRHAESLSNAGFATDSPHDIGLSAKGTEQALAIAQHWRGEAPELIVISRYARTGATAAPLREKFPSCPVMTLPLHELTFLAPAAYIGTTEELRREPARRFWDRADPDFCDGEGAETFRGFIERVDASVRLLQERAERRIAVFCHGYVIKAILWRLLMPDRVIDSDAMRDFFAFHLRMVVPNGFVYPFTMQGADVKTLESPFDATQPY